MRPGSRLARSALSVVTIAATASALVACGANDGPPSRPDYMDPSIGQTQVAAALIARFCEPGFSDPPTRMGGNLRYTCAAADTTSDDPEARASVLVLHVFDTTADAQAYLAADSCEPGLTYAKGPRWVGGSTDAATTQALVDAGADETCP